jgi:hypothetical protein
MRSRFSANILKHLMLPFVLLPATGVALGTTGVLAGTSGLPLGVSTACGCEIANIFSVTANPSPQKGKGVVTFTIMNESTHAAKVNTEKGELGIKLSPMTHNEWVETTMGEISTCESKTYKAKGNGTESECQFKMTYQGNVAENLTVSVRDENAKLGQVTAEGKP